MPPFNPSSKPVLAVVGAGPGIGEAVARKFVSEGFTVALLARTETKLQEMVSSIASDFGSHTAKYYITDLRVESDIIKTFASIKQDLGPVNVLVYNAGARRVNGDALAVQPEHIREAARSEAVSGAGHRVGVRVLERRYELR